MRRGAVNLLKSSLYIQKSQHPFKIDSKTISMTTGEMINHERGSGVSLADLPKSHIFTTYLPPDALIPTPEASKGASPQLLRVSRPVRNALFTWVAPEHTENPQLLATSWRALKDLGLNDFETETEDFLKVVSGNKIYEEHFPWGPSNYL
jgi:hypothetical protein